MGVISWIFALTTVLGAAHADYRCSPSLIDTMTILDIPKMMGIWKLYAINYQEEVITDISCWEFEWKLNGTTGLIDAREGYSSGSYSYKYPITVSNWGRPGKWGLGNSADELDDSMMYIVHTDYWQNTLLATCSTAANRESVNFFLLARNLQIPVISEQYKFIMSTGFGIDIAKLITVSHDLPGDERCG